jgi:hypothetical protein
MSRETSSGLATVRQLCRAFELSRQAYYAALRPPATKPPTERRHGCRFSRSRDL